MKLASTTAALALTFAVTLVACGGGDDGLSKEQSDLAQQIARDAGIKTDVAECLVGKVTNEMGETAGTSALEGDTDLSELDGEEGAAVASAFSECSDDSFEQVFGYYPEN